jgi:hypothetical protein
MIGMCKMWRLPTGIVSVYYPGRSPTRLNNYGEGAGYLGWTEVVSFDGFLPRLLANLFSCSGIS